MYGLCPLKVKVDLERLFKANVNKLFVNFSSLLGLFGNIFQKNGSSCDFWLMSISLASIATNLGINLEGSYPFDIFLGM